jgi:hypothetical protein
VVGLSRHTQFWLVRPNAIEVTVNDNGPGIDAAVIDTLFDPIRTTKLSGMRIALFQTQTGCNCCVHDASGVRLLFLTADMPISPLSTGHAHLPELHGLS